MAGFIEQQVDKWYGSTPDRLQWEERQEIIEMVANCIIASQLDSTVITEAERIVGICQKR